MSDLLYIAKEILEANPHCALSGSLALLHQGKNVRREPKDIDIYLPYSEGQVSPSILEGMKMDIGALHEDDHYENEYFERLPYKYKGVNVDFFRPIGPDVFPIECIEKDGLRVVAMLDIMKMKVSHAWGDHFSKFKHRQDLIYMMLD